jgi:hypothetical protein
VRRLLVSGFVGGLDRVDPDDRSESSFSSEDLGRLVAVAGSSLTELRVGFGLDVVPDLEPFWGLLQDNIVPAGRLRSLVVDGAEVRQSDVEHLGLLLRLRHRRWRATQGGQGI